MRSWFLPSAEIPAFEWLAFMVFLLVLFICLASFVFWLKTRKTRRKRKHKHRHRHGHSTPDRVGGVPSRGELPPRRDLNQLPPGS